VIVYGSRTFDVDVPAFVAALRRRLDNLPIDTSASALVDLLVDFGEVESAVADALQPEADDEPAALAPWTSTGDALARALCAVLSSDRTCAVASVHDASLSARAMNVSSWPGALRTRVPEGFAQYGLFPQQYAAAAVRLVQQRAPASLECIGIRGIGLPLAHVVAAAAALRGVRTKVRSVRPRGHPFDRRVVLGADLTRAIAASRADVFAVVDEGPGLSGSSFAAAAEALIGCGIEARRIVLLPSWDAPVESLRSERGRRTWESHPRLVVGFEQAMSGSLPFSPDAEDLSAGKWRERILAPDAPWPAVHPQHERRKHLAAAGTIFRFAGFGRHGRSAYDRAVTIAEHGYGAEPLALDSGFLQQRWTPGAPLEPHPAVTADLLDRLARYLAFIKQTFATGSPDDIDELGEMIEINLSEDQRGAQACAVRSAALPVARLDGRPERVAIDGRMMPHEWIRSGTDMMKVDALDHHADDFFPGCRDIAWDVAGAIVEFELDAGGASALLERYTKASGDRTIDRRLGFYRTAYHAWRLGYAALAAETLGDSPDGRRFRADWARYRRSSAGPAADSLLPARRC